MTTKPKNDILQGTLTLLVLRSLEGQGPLHGYALCGHIQRVSDDTLRVEEGSLYPGPAPHGAGGLGGRLVARHREGPAREVLPASPRSAARSSRPNARAGCA